MSALAGSLGSKCDCSGEKQNRKIVTCDELHLFFISGFSHSVHCMNDSPIVSARLADVINSYYHVSFQPPTHPLNQSLCKSSVFSWLLASVACNLQFKKNVNFMLTCSWRTPDVFQNFSTNLISTLPHYKMRQIRTSWLDHFIWTKDAREKAYHITLNHNRLGHIENLLQIFGI